MFEGASSALNVGSAVYAPLEPRPIYFVTSATTSAGILRRTISPALTQINLAVHHSRYVHNTVANRVGPSNFSIVPRPPYHPKYGPIEYKVCEVMEKIRVKKEEDWNMNRLEHEILLAANQIERFEETFIHCGY